MAKSLNIFTRFNTSYSACNLKLFGCYAVILNYNIGCGQGEQSSYPLIKNPN